jgi:hypothetical protein
VRPYFVSGPDDELRELLGLLRVHAGRGLVQQQKLRLGRQRAGYLKPSLQAVRQAGGKVVLVLQKSLLFQQRLGLVPHALFFGGRYAEGGGKDVLICPHVLCCEDVFKNGHALPQTDVLEGAGYAQLGDNVRGGTRWP